MDLGAFKPAIVYTIYIASTPQKVWQALTDPAQLREAVERITAPARRSSLSKKLDQPPCGALGKVMKTESWQALLSAI